MENKKQLVIVPPMSEPLQKLNEVLNGIAGDENIEISLVDDLKELSQFLGSAGQCLVVFANAKKCATFLQENRFAIAKVHSKVILLTPKEIPAKTLIKFTKIGLTESILESSPPKTLLYKVKLLLRSIKTSALSEDKDQVIKSMLDTTQPAATKGEIGVDKIDTPEAVENYSEEKATKIKKDQEENSIRYDNLRGKSKYQEEVIETNWKSKRKREDDSTLEIAEEDEETKLRDDDDMDMYYRGKTKKQNIDLELEEENTARKKLNSSDEEESEFMKRRTVENSNIDLEEAEEKKKSVYEENTDDYNFKESRSIALFSEEEVEARPKYQTEEEEEQETKKRELAELDALFEEVNKKHKEGQVDDLGGYLKGKINNSNLDLEDDQEIELEEEIYNHESTRERQKQTDLDLAPGEEDGRREYQTEEDDEKKRKKTKAEVLGENLTSDNGSTDHIETMIKGSIDHTKGQIELEDIEEERKSHLSQEEENDPTFRKQKEKALDLDEDEADLEKEIYDTEDDEDRRREKMLDLEETDFKHKKLNNTDDADNKDANESDDSSKLKLIDGDVAARRSKYEDEDNELNFKKLNQTDLGLDTDKDRTHDGKVDKIDTFYRSGESKKTEHSWDNLTDKKNTALALEKGKAKEDENIAPKASKDAGEITIDYRKLKAEFEAMQEGLDDNGPEGIRSRYGSESGHNGEESSFKVIVPDPVGLDFGISILNMLYLKETKALDIYKTVTEELLKGYKAYAAFYTYKVSDKKHSEIFDCYTHLNSPQITDDLIQWWNEFKKEEVVFTDYYSKTMPTWICRSIPSKSSPEAYWEDVELPSWAANELTDKRVELVYPYFDGLDRAGVAIMIFPHGLNPGQGKAIELTLELARTALLDSIQRKSASSDNRRLDETTENEAATSDADQKNILGKVFGLFNKKKAG